MKNYSKYLFVVAFFILLITPNFIMVVKGNGVEDTPGFNGNLPLKSLASIKSYYNDNFGLKSEMVSGYIDLKTNLLNDSPIPHRVVEGNDGWYFLGNHYNELLNDSFGAIPLSLADLQQITEAIETIKLKLERRGIDFYIVVPPNKHRVYAEYLPYQLKQKPTSLEQIIQVLKRELNFEIIDLRDTLLASKNTNQLYYKSNTHWNDLGAFIGYKKTIHTLGKKVPVEQESDYTIKMKPIKRGDIIEMINLRYKEPGITLERNNKSSVVTLKSDRVHLHFENPNGNLKLLMYRDSFANAWIPYFNESFSESVYLRSYEIDYDFIDQYQPNVVVYEIIERNLIPILLNKKGASN